MVTVILLVIGVLVVSGAIYMVMSKGSMGARDGQSSTSVATAQRQEKVRVNSVRATGSGDD